MSDNNLDRKDANTNSANTASPNAVRSAVRRATVMSAKIERRPIPANYVRTSKVAQFLNDRHRSS